MMTHYEKEDLAELAKLLEKVSHSASFLTDESNRGDKLEAVRLGLQSFHTTAAMLDMKPVEESGLALMDFFTSNIAAADSMDPNLLFPFVSTIKAIVGELKSMLNGDGDGEAFQQAGYDKLSAYVDYNSVRA